MFAFYRCTQEEEIQAVEVDKENLQEEEELEGIRNRRGVIRDPHQIQIQVNRRAWKWRVRVLTFIW